jgi:N6-L-threonylcarbamoyladenine synthase
MEMIVPLAASVLEQGKAKLNDIDGIAVTRAPGLIGALLVGLSFAKALSFVLKRPLIGVNHLEGHLNAAHLEYDDIPCPHIGLVVSGGHTSIYHVKGFGRYRLLGATRDDAAGEAFDKVAKLLGLGYPGGPKIEAAAKGGDPRAFKFTRPKMNTGSRFEVGELDFSFSGIKTAVMMECKKNPPRPPFLGRGGFIADMAASFQSAVVDILCRQVAAACRAKGCHAVVVSGGVAANGFLRSRLKDVCEGNGLKHFIPGLKFCTDNAAMIAYVGGRYLEAGKRDDMRLAAVANEEIGLC